jgi:hypothetical protein
MTREVEFVTSAAFLGAGATLLIHVVPAQSRNQFEPRGEGHNLFGPVST